MDKTGALSTFYSKIIIFSKEDFIILYFSFFCMFLSSKIYDDIYCHIPNIWDKYTKTFYAMSKPMHKLWDKYNKTFYAMSKPKHKLKLSSHHFNMIYFD